MSGNLRVSIYRNDYDHCSPEQNCVITLQPDSNRISFQRNLCDVALNNAEFVIYDSGLRNSIGCALSRWLGDGNPLCTYAMRFRTAEVYRQWRRSVFFEDCDVSWHVAFELRGGEIITYVCIGQYPIPAEISDIIREVIDCWKHSN